MSAMESGVSMKYQGVGKRLVALVIDTIILGVVAWIIALATGGTTDSGFAVEGLPALVVFAIGIGYFVLLEAYVGGTVGKLVLGMRVVKEDGSPCDLQASIIRNVLRIFDGILVYLVGAILIWKSSKRQRLGDRVANTVVVAK